MRKLASAFFAFAVGIFAAQYLLPFSWLLPAAGAFVVLGGLCTLLFKGTRRIRLTLLCAGIAFALVYNGTYVTLVQTPNEALADTTEALTLELCDYADATDQGARVSVRILNHGLRGKALYYGTEELLKLSPGDRISAESYISSAATIREADVTTFTSKGIYLLLYNRGEETVLSENGNALRYLP